MSKENLKKQKITKKEVKSIVYNKLAAALSDYKKEIKPKKFEAKLKKASKLFATDIIKAAGKPAPAKVSGKRLKNKKQPKQETAS